MLFTSESVSEGHPDKLCDQVSDAILDACLEQDPNSKVACETSAKTGFVLVFGEITTNADIDFQKVVRDTVRNIGYNDSSTSFDADTCAVLVSVEKQSPEIFKGVFKKDLENQGAGDQGMMFGYATNETKELHPLTHVLSNKILKKMADLRKNNTLKWALPDAKSQVTIEYNDLNGELKPKRIHTILISTQHKPDVTNKKINDDIKNLVINKIVPKKLIDDKTKIIINPSGSFIIGGPDGDSGLTGRKIIVDTYGGAAPHGGGAFSGKDPSKVDRSAAYASRYLAKNIVAANLADECTIQLAYAIGVSKPLSVYVNTNGTNKVDEQKIEKSVQDLFDLSPRGIREHLKLTNAIYVPTSAYGHFGREPNDQGHFTWEKTDLVDSLKNLL